MWKKDEDGNLSKDAEGNPILILADGKEQGFSVTKNNEYIQSLKDESAGRRTENNTLKEQLKSFEGLNADEARKAIDKVQSFSDKDLIDAGKVDEIKAEMARVHASQLQEERDKSDAYRSRINNFMIGQAFGESSYIKDNLTIPADMVRTSFGNRFMIDANNRVVALRDPNDPASVIYSDANAGDPASVDEALAKIIASYPHKDHILKSSGSQGGGSNGNHGGGGGNAPKSYADAKTEAEKIAYLKNIK